MEKDDNKNITTCHETITICNLVLCYIYIVLKGNKGCTTHEKSFLQLRLMTCKNRLHCSYGTSFSGGFYGMLL